MAKSKKTEASRKKAQAQHPSSLRVSYSERVLTVLFDHEPTRNSFNQERASDLISLLKSLHEGEQPEWEDHPVGAVVFKSSLKGVFVSGGDLTEIMKSPVGAWSTMSTMREATNLIGRLPCLSVALLEGKAIGGGAELALACDERWVASNEAALELRQRDWGLPAGWNGLDNLLRVRPEGGLRRARMDFVMGRTWSAEDLLAEGIAQQDLRKLPKMRQKALLEEQAARVCACPARLRAALLKGQPSESQLTSAPSTARLFEDFWLRVDHLSALKRHQAALRRHRTAKKQDDRNTRS